MRMMRLVHLLLPLSLLFSEIARADAPKPAPDDPRRRFIAQLEAVVQREPTHVGAVYLIARTAAGIGDEALMLTWLDRLEGLRFGDSLDDVDFGAMANTPAYRERAARFAAAAPAVGKADARETRCSDVLPEGTAWDAKRKRLLISSGRQRTVYSVGEDGSCAPLLPPGGADLLATLGMWVDAATDSLWVASAAAPFMVNAKPEETGAARVSRIDLAKGVVARSWPLPGPGLLNDLALAADGSVYVTESRGGTVYRLAPGADSLKAVLPNGTMEGPNGIVVLPGGELLVADFHGLSLVRDAAGAEAKHERLAGAGGEYLGGIDGLARSGAHVVGIQNLVGLGRVWSLKVDLAARKVTPTLLLRGDRQFMNPTTGVIVGNEFRFLADPRLQNDRPGGGVSPLPAGRTGHRLLTLPLN